MERWTKQRGSGGFSNVRFSLRKTKSSLFASCDIWCVASISCCPADVVRTISKVTPHVHDFVDGEQDIQFDCRKTWS